MTLPMVFQGKDASVDPVLDSQTWDLAEVPHIAGDERRPMSQSYARDQQIGTAEFLNLLIAPQFVEPSRRGAFDRQHGDLSEQLLASSEPFERSQKLVAVRRF
jgi:hypothetical protein